MSHYGPITYRLGDTVPLCHTDMVGQGVHIVREGKCVQRSRNLRGITSRAGKVGVAQATVLRAGPNGTEGHVWLVFKDGSWTRHRFACFTVARDFFRARWQRWGLHAEVRCSDNYWSFI